MCGKDAWSDVLHMQHMTTQNGEVEGHQQHTVAETASAPKKKKKKKRADAAPAQPAQAQPHELAAVRSGSAEVDPFASSESMTAQQQEQQQKPAQAQDPDRTLSALSSFLSHSVPLPPSASSLHCSFALT